MLHDPHDRHRAPSSSHTWLWYSISRISGRSPRSTDVRYAARRALDRRLNSAKSASDGLESRQPLKTTMSSPRLVPTSTR